MIFKHGDIGYWLTRTAHQMISRIYKNLLFFFLLFFRYNFMLYPKYKKKCRNNFKIRENRTCSFGVWSDELNIYLYIYFFSYLDQIRHCIIFHRIGEGDSGVYSCQAVNPLGEAVCEAEFQIVPGEGIFKIFIFSFLFKKYIIIFFFLIIKK